MNVRNRYREAWSSSEGADLYEKARPGYAAEAIRFLQRTFGIDLDSVVLDLAAGSGKLTRQLLTTGARVIAVEPLEGMRTAFSRMLPTISILNGRAEAIPVAAATIDMVVAGQAWHWFDSVAALAEVSRVVIPGGGLALLWNEYDETQPWVHEYAEIRRRSENPVPWRTDSPWTEAFTGTDHWAPLQLEVFSHQSEMTRAALVERMLSSSAITVLPADEKTRVQEAVLRVLDNHPETKGRVFISLPYRTQVFWTRHVITRSGPLSIE